MVKGLVSHPTLKEYGEGGLYVRFESVDQNETIETGGLPFAFMMLLDAMTASKRLHDQPIVI